jgi:4-amino-4-deoxychorismate lyase
MNLWTQLGPDEQGWITERACQYGDGLFETVAVRKGQPCLWRYHLDRLLEGCDRLALPRPDTAQLEDIVRNAANGHDTIGLKLYWTAGRSARGYRRHPPLSPHGYLQTFPWRPPGERRPWHVRFCHHRVSENPRLAEIKHLNRLDQVLGRAEWEDDQFDEGLMFGQDGRLVCGTRSNIVLELKGRLVTPRIDRAGVAGVVRRCLIEEARRQHVDLEIRPVKRDEISMAEALYLTNALIGVQPVKRCEDRLFDVDRPTPAPLERVDRLALCAMSEPKAS